MALSERRGEVIVGGSFVVAALALPLIGGVNQRFSLPIAALYVLCIAVAGYVRFDVGAGFTVPTQAIFVPMLFAVPVSLVPLLVALALALEMAPTILSGRASASRILTVPGNSWFAWGPALVLLVADDHRPDGRWGILLLALGAQFACDFAQSVVRERLCHGVSMRDLLAEVRQIYAIDLAFSPLGLAAAIAIFAVHDQLSVLLIAPLFAVLGVFSKERQARLEQLLELNDAYQGTALLLGDVVEADDTYTGEHCKSVVRLALDVATDIGLSADQMRNVEFGALLHDVGKIAVPKEIINKPGKLDEREWAIIKTHTIEGQKMLERVGGFMAEIGGIVRASHERWDGSGYPDGLSGDEIPIEARIVSACDAFNAMTTTRSYRKAVSVSDAVAEVERCAGTQFDPQVVAGLVRVATASPETAEQGHADDGPAAASSLIASDLLSLDIDSRPSSATSPPATIEPSRTRPACRYDSEDARKELVHTLADLAVTVGANVQQGQDVEVTGEIGHLDTVRAIVNAAYRAGARHVDVRLNDPLVQRARISVGPEDALDHVPDWEVLRVRDLAEQRGASILVTGPTFPHLLDDLDPRLIARADVGPSSQWRQAERTLNWTIVPAATAGWATQLRPQLPDEQALSALWSDLAHACRLDEPDPKAAWRARLATLKARANWLTALKLDAVHLKGPGTDLTVGLLGDGRWVCPQMTTPRGIEFVPNLPTEEIYTTPDAARVSGQVRLTRPICLGGRLIDDVALRFADGRLVDIAGPPEISALREFVQRDPGTSRLGELALVDSESRIARLDQIFGEILLDENAASHIALGQAFVELEPGSNSAANSSDHHLDLMFGSPQVRVTGCDRHGNTHTLLHDGCWAGPA
jgi:putative nucleotidyltransferase with HDIG domain